MSALNTTTNSAVLSSLSGAWAAFAKEASVVLGALMNPRKVLDEVEQMRKLFNAAHALEQTDPARAEALRARAARIGLN
ncbi:hypothetical protein QTH91_03135 [Variovorax dokdonensis]|uniref:Uncharacterized protein n=1 Tax=Variovorax dokdonensis TaxID=344883 RepID=A0ABT7N691_9BURK|nr:hypothetical protein [Variovorax dokdonensis]MDM0043464.1 hypothetical protein [Variovorax dokdonensis]